MSHYYINDPNLEHDYQSFYYSYGKKTLHFTTDAGVFSKSKVDEGSHLLLQNLPKISGSVLDLGCGYGPIGLSLLANFDLTLSMSDVNVRALDLAKLNAKNNNLQDIVFIESNGFERIGGLFDYILLNPPIRAGKKVTYQIYEDAKDHLKEGGSFIIVIQKKQGAKSTLEKLATIYSEVNILYKKKGWFVIESKNSAF